MSYDYYFWIDAGLSHCGLIPNKYLATSLNGMQKYYESSIFTNIFLKNLIKNAKDKFTLIKKENSKHYWSGTVNPSHFYDHDASRHVIGGFFGGKKERVIDFCKTLREWQLEDQKIPYEPGVNDESYINAYFHYNPPMTVSCENFAFDISDKGGIGETRNMSLDIKSLLKEMLNNKNNSYNIYNGRLNVI
jgi:hypothetical protein